MDNALAQLMENNLQLVWNERNANHRIAAIEKLYVNNSTLFEVGETITGYEAINNAVTRLVNGVPPNFVFTKLKPVIINNNAGRLIWGLGPKGRPPTATGMDVAIFENGKIKYLYVFLNNNEG